MAGERPRPNRPRTAVKNRKIHMVWFYPLDGDFQNAAQCYLRPMSTMPLITLPTGQTVPALGQGTWTMGDAAKRRKEEIAALRLGLDLGMTLIDTAEMYASGGAEEVVGEAVAGRRDEVFLVTKVMPGNASRRGTAAACEKSLKRLKTDRVDLYLLHWPGPHPIAETVEAFTTLKRAGKIRHWGVSNFDVSEMEEVAELPDGKEIATNQVMYNLRRRGIEFDLIPWCERRRIPIMAYSPLDQGRLLRAGELESVAARHETKPAQLALAWLLQQEGVMVIPKAGSEAHVRENHGALAVRLEARDLAELDRAFPPPAKKKPLASS
jgi:diketogulonate reductase-like aldo/keto reductase